MKPNRRLFIAATAALCLAGASPGFAADKPSGTVVISQVQVAFLFSGNVGGGTLTFKGKDYPFSIGGLGYGGIGASKIEASGEVYGLERIEDFTGPYAQGRYGAVASDTQLGGDFWLYNPQGVEMRLKSKREGYALSLGADAVYIQFHK